MTIKLTTEQELKDRCTPKTIEWMCKLAEGFEKEDDSDYQNYLHQYIYADYQSDSLILAECAMLNCLQDRFKE